LKISELLIREKFHYCHNRFIDFTLLFGPPRHLFLIFCVCLHGSLAFRVMTFSIFYREANRLPITVRRTEMAQAKKEKKPMNQAQ